MRRKLAFSVLLCFVACSEDEPSPAPPRVEGGAAGDSDVPLTAGGGDGGAPSVGAPSVGGVGGQAGDQAGVVSAGQAGEGGVPTLPPLGEQCVASNDCAALSSCADSEECAPWLSCLQGCDDAACVDDCDDAFPDLSRVAPGVYACLCEEEGPCASLGACSKTSCVGEEPEVSPTAPLTLAETGWRALEGSYDYEPQFPLWSDGLEKTRQIWLPRCSTIDTSDMDEWQFPVGTRLWKTFGQSGVAIETRLTHRYGPGPTEWLYAAYQWDPEAPEDATRALWTGGAVVTNANGTGHDIPGNGNCKQCHDGRRERSLGFSAIQLSHDAAAPELTLRRISLLGWLTVPAPGGFTVPGNATQRAALGYLHGNCGGCHDQDGKLPDPESPLILRLLVAQTEYTQTDVVRTTVNVPVRSGLAELSGKLRVAAAAPENSGILLRMQARGIAGLQMPPYNSNSTKQPDTVGGVADVTAWVTSLSP